MSASLLPLLRDTRVDPHLSDQPVELVLLVRSVQGHGLHAHRLAVLAGLVLLKVPAAKLPGDHKALALPEVVGSLGGALGSASRDAEMIERSLEVKIVISGHQRSS